MGCGLWVFTKLYMQWLPGDQIEPNMCLSGGQMKMLRDAGILVPVEQYVPAPKRASVPVVETADAPPTGETAARTSRPKPGRLTRTEKQSSKKEDSE